MTLSTNHVKDSFYKYENWRGFKRTHKAQGVDPVARMPVPFYRSREEELAPGLSRGAERAPAEQVKNFNRFNSRVSLPLAFIHLDSCASAVLASPAPQGVSRVRNIKGQFNLARPQLPSILIQTAMTEELIFHLSEGRSRPLNHCNSH